MKGLYKYFYGLPWLSGLLDDLINYGPDDNIIHWGDHSGDLTLWGDHSGTLHLWGAS